MEVTDLIHSMADLVVLPSCLKLKLIALLTSIGIILVHDVADPDRGRMGSWIMTLEHVRGVPPQLKELARTFMRLMGEAQIGNDRETKGKEC